MKNKERWNQIVQLVDQYGFLSVQELSKLCDTSVVTTRRDLQYLHSANRIRRTHGGAAALPEATEAPQTSLSIDNGYDLNSKRYSFDHLDALVTADTLPKFASLIQQAGGKQKIPIIAESIPLPNTEGAPAKRGENDGMAQTDLKRELMAELEAEVDALVEWDRVTAEMTLTDIEEVLLAARQRISTKMAQRLIERQEEKRAAAIPENRTNGRRLHPKGKKREG